MGAHAYADVVKVYGRISRSCIEKMKRVDGEKKRKEEISMH